MSKREILFRGKRKDNGEWIYGVPITDKATNDAYIITSTAGASLKSEINNMCATGFRVIRNTIGQYTSMTDRDDTKIFEGDIVNARWFDKVERAFVCYAEDYLTWVLEYSDDEHNDMNLFFKNEIKVIGNIYDNPELLKGE